MPGSAFRSVAVAVLRSTAPVFGATVACVAGAVVECGGIAVPAGSAAKTGVAMVKANKPIGRCENFNMEISILGRDAFARPERRLYSASSIGHENITIVILWPD